MRRKLVFHLFGVALALSLAAPLVSARGHNGDQGKGGGKHKGAAKQEAKIEREDAREEVREARPRTSIEQPRTTPERARARPRDVVVIDRNGHRRVVTEYYSREGLPPGLAKRQSLPPGLAKQLRERGHLPPGLQKRLTPVPAPLAGRLPAVPPYYSRYFAGRDLVIVDRRTNTVAAIVPNVLPR